MGRLRIQLVGPLLVTHDGRARSAAEIGSRKARQLLALLATARGRVVTVDRIVAVLWPGRPPRRPAENVATLVSRVRAALGPGVLVGGRAGYRLGDDVETDVREAELLLADAESRLPPEPAVARAAAQAAARRGAGPRTPGSPTGRRSRRRARRRSAAGRTTW
ncbi:winged helix-turn-helix domain-containing protein [Amorphoplanes digitatis]|uniref:DNA-binding SARP family transcriptional activator n=1 Tax=Actinoplanes digitatis TaxID=1868 RepID=A0A7W7I5K2_9ACTN|nr:winged helix-turn-helix domain-containing protein [Actinoplanes digitatis]MBB4766711.1 DNA-binding SARP family transcriptional activator [Actinoplanes digitatis]BFE76861.1 hypothetical protein GCM10020092_101620 [Actinoplanes digitatis]GID96684.1 hypothetical protein Adi01nite_60960 [Actinoplanes digitatis]